MSGSPKKRFPALVIALVLAAAAGFVLRSMVLGDMAAGNGTLAFVTTLALFILPVIAAAAAFLIGSRTGVHAASPAETPRIAQRDAVAAAAEEPASTVSPEVQAATPAAPQEAAAPSAGTSEPVVVPTVAAEPVIPEAPAIDDEPEEDLGEEPLPVAGGEDRLKKIIIGLDELAKAQNLGKDLHPEQIDLPAYLDELVRSAAVRSDGREPAFSLDCPEGLMLQADRQCLSIVMTNLIDNALNAAAEKGSVAVRAGLAGGSVELIVEDTGKGIKKKDLPHVFERFYRGSGNGLGLGLTIVEELVRASGGVIQVTSKRGKGTKVVVTLPAIV